MTTQGNDTLVPCGEQELKACPYCNKPASEGEFSDGVNIRYYTSCDDEECIGWELWNAQYMTREQARTAWNRRASPWRTDWENAPKGDDPLYVYGRLADEPDEPPFKTLVKWDDEREEWIEIGGLIFEPTHFITPPAPVSGGK